MPSYIRNISGTFGGKSGTSTSTVTAGAEHVIDEALPSGQTDVVYAVGCTAAKIASVFIKPTVATTIKTYDDSNVLVDTLTFAADESLEWDSNGPYVCPFTDDFATIKITNVAAGYLQFYVLYDPT